MQDIFNNTLGTVFYSVVVFVVGSLVGQQLWTWVSRFFPWNKK